MSDNLSSRTTWRKHYYTKGKFRRNIWTIFCELLQIYSQEYPL